MAIASTMQDYMEEYYEHEKAELESSDLPPEEGRLSFRICCTSGRCTRTLW